MRIKNVCFLPLIFLIILSFPVRGLAQDDSLLLEPKFTEFSQAANEDPTLGDIHWIGSILQITNSRYYEGMSVCQRLIFNGISSTPGDTHALTLSHQAVKGGIHAYDFLTSWDNAIPAADSIAPGQNLLVNLFSDQCDPEFWGSSQAICDYIHSLGLYDEADLTVLDMGSIGGHNVEQRADNYDTYFGIPRTVKIWGSDSVSSAYITFDGYTGSTDNEYANYTLHWTSASDTVIIEFAGHLAVSVDPLNAGIGYGAGLGAAAIAGGPYHITLSYLDGSSLGSQDNQIKGADILLPALECRVVPDADSVCVGGSATFIDSSRGGTQPYSWSWTGPNGFTASTQSITINNAQLVNAGTYQVIVTDNNGLKDTCTAELVVWSPPVCSITGDSVICEGSTADFCATGGMASYSWSGPGGFTSSNQCTGPIGEAGYYKVIITDANGCVDSCGKTLVVNPKPVVTAPDTVEFDLCDTATVCIDITLYDLDDLNIFVNPPGQFNPSDSSICFFADRDTTYPFTIIATDTCGNSDTAYAIALVNFNDPPEVNSPDTVRYQLEDTATFCFDITLYDPDNEITVTVNPPGQYNPSDSSICFFADRDTIYHFTIIVIDTCETLPPLMRGIEMSSVTILADTSYTVAIITSNDPPVVIVPADVDTTLCEPETLCFIVQATDPDVGDTIILEKIEGPGTFSPDTGFSPLSDPICFLPADVDSTYRFIFRVTDHFGETDEDTFYVTVNLQPVVCSITGDSVICEGSSADFCATPGMASYSWSGPGAFSASTQCTGPIGVAGYYEVIITDANGCADTCGRTLVVTDKPVCSVTGDSVVCEGSTADFCATAGMASYSWSGPGGFSASTQCTGPIEVAGYYEVIITATGGCADTCGRTLVVNTQPVCEGTGDDTVCTGSTTDFCATPGMSSYSWSGPGGFIGSNQCTGPIGIAGEYTVIITDANGCADTCSRTLTVNDQPVCSITGDSVICEGSSADFCATPGMASYSWSGPGAFSASTQCTGPIGVAGYYEVIITDANGCADTCGRTLVVTDKPVCSVTGDSVVCEGSTTNFCATPGMASYSWSGPGAFSASTQCTGSIGLAGYYKVIITDANGCADTCGRTLVVHTKPVCSITGDRVIDVGDTTEFCATPGMSSYSWIGPGGFSASTQCTGPIADSGYYQVTIIDANGCKNTCGRELVFTVPISSMTTLGLVLLVLVLSGIFGYLIFIRRKRVVVKMNLQ